MARLRVRPWHQGELLGPYRFFDVQGLHQSAAKGHSLVNIAEIRVAMQLYERLTTDFRDYDFSGKIGIITPYKGQLRELKTQFAARFGNSIFSIVDFNTTDAFQGRESEVIIFSCVRASNKGIGFLADIRRMNVGLTRAKSSLWVLGNSQSLVQGEFWRKLVNDSRERNMYTEGDVLAMLQRPQFNGYKDVQMVDVDDPAREPPSVSSRAPSASSISRPSSALESGDSPWPMPMSASARGTPPAPVPDGASGGPWGLDETKMCGICGSSAHMTRNCDNTDAQEVTRGTCIRCRKPGHTRAFCTADRCIECGQIGHLARSCTSTKLLSKQEKSRVVREENNLAHIQKQRAERQRQRQLGGHDPKVPVIQVATDPPVPNAKKPDLSRTGGKQSPIDASNNRKRRGSPISAGPKTSRQRTSEQGGPPLNVPKAPKGGRRNLDSNVPGFTDVSYLHVFLFRLGTLRCCGRQTDDSFFLAAGQTFTGRTGV